MAKQGKFDLEGVMKRFEQTKSELPKIFANDAQLFFESSFKKEGWTDETFKRWKPRQARKSVKRKDQTRNILVKSGFLRRNFSVKSATFNNITIANSTPYAAIHNNGFNGSVSVSGHKREGKAIKTKVRGSSGFVNGKFTKGKSKTLTLAGNLHDVGSHSRNMNMPQRQFMGHSKTLEKIQMKKIDKALKEIWK